jgi:hypothetical protein
MPYNYCLLESTLMGTELPEGWFEVTPGSFSDGAVRVDARTAETIEFGIELSPDKWEVSPVPSDVIRAALRATVARSSEPCFCSACYRGDPEECEKVWWIERLREEGYTIIEPGSGVVSAIAEAQDHLQGALDIADQMDELLNNPNPLREKLEAEGLMKHVENPGLAYREGLAEGNRIRLEEHRRYRSRALWAFGIFFLVYLLIAGLGILIGWP